MSRRRCEVSRLGLQRVHAGTDPPGQRGRSDGVFEVVPEGKTFTYDFVAEPFGIFPYHCHMMPLRKHIARGLYGTLIVDPGAPRPPATEMIMVMHGLDVDLDMENEFYAVNGVANLLRRASSD